MRFHRTTYRRIVIIGILVSLLIFGVRPLLFHGYADKLPNRSLRLDVPTQGTTTGYHFTFDTLTSSTVGSVRFQFCSDTPLVGYPCTPPAGFDASSAALTAQTGETGYTVAPSTNANEIYLTRLPSMTASGTSTYDFSGIVNPSAVGTYFVRIETYSSIDASGSSTDDGGLAFVINNAIDVSSYVPPYLLFCSGVTISGFDCTTASGDYINFGELSSATTKYAKSQMLVATNASAGYSVWADGSTMASGTDIIPAISGSDVSRPGTSQFGINLAANTTPSIGENVAGPGTATVSGNYSTADRFRFVPGEQLAGGTGVNDYRKFTVSYIVNIAKAQPSGIYISTLSYVCLANF